MTTNRNNNRVDIYITTENKTRLKAKAAKLGFSLSSLLVEAAFNYEPDCQQLNDKESEEPKQ
jgi:type II secretory pathway component HofQ